MRRKRKDSALCEYDRNQQQKPRTIKPDIKDQFIAHIQELNHKVASLQMQLTKVKSENTGLQGQVLKLETALKEKDDENTILKDELEKIPTVQKEEPENQSTLHKMTLLERESSLKEFEIRDLRENLLLQKYITEHMALSNQKKKRRAYTKPPPVSASYASSVCSSTVSTISLLQQKYERSATFKPKESGMELPIKLFDCYLDDDGSAVEIDVVKIPSSRAVRIRVRAGNRFEDLDIRDVYANIVSDTMFHLETFDNGYYLCSRQSHISVQEIVEDINAFQTDGFLPNRVNNRNEKPI